MLDWVLNTPLVLGFSVKIQGNFLTLDGWKLLVKKMAKEVMPLCITANGNILASGNLCFGVFNLQLKVINKKFISDCNGTRTKWLWVPVPLQSLNLKTSDIAPVSCKEFLDIQANIVCIHSETRTWHVKKIQSNKNFCYLYSV